MSHPDTQIESIVDTAGQSTQLLQEAARYVPGGVNSCKRNRRPALCMRAGQGPYIEDLDGRRYIDYHAAYGPIILGHAYEHVTDRVAEALRRGVAFGFGTTEAEVELARKIVSHVPSVDQVLLCNSGSDATFHAIRLARAITGRAKIIKFQGHYNGFHDYALCNVLSNRDMLGRHDPHSAGMLSAALENTLACRFNDASDVERKLSENAGEVAAVIIEPVAHNSPGIMPHPGFLAELRRLCEREGVLLVFDEVISGFRHHIGGYQAIAGVMPDLTTMGKAIANGYPIAAVGGRRELMERFNTKSGGDVYFGGTYNGNLVGVAAALATIEILESEPVYDHIFRLGDRMRAGLAEIGRGMGIPVTVGGYGSLFTLLFMEGPLDSYDDALRNDAELFVRYRRELISRGIFEAPENLGRSHISYSHTESHIDQTLEVAERALRSAVEGSDRH